VVPLVDQWRQRGGVVELDQRAIGGHTSDWATKALLLDVIGRMYRGEPATIDRYQREAPYLGQLVRPPLSHRVRQPLGRLRRRLFARSSRPQD
jgi:hypothetical protein